MVRFPHDGADMPLTGSRAGALRVALSNTAGRPLPFFPLVLATAVIVAAILTGAIFLWRLQPLEAPPWVRPQALVMAAGAEGETDLAALGLALRKVGNVLAADFVGRDAALANLSQRPGLASLGLRELRPNPLPDSFVVTFAPEAGPDGVEAAVAELAKVKSVESVRYQPEAYRRTWALAQLARRLVLLAGGALIATGIVGIIAAAGFGAKPDPEELRLLDALGADPAAVRRPYVYGGAFSVLCVAALAWWMTSMASTWLDPLFADLAGQYTLHWSADVLPEWYGPAFCLLAAVFGGLIASVATRLAVRSAIA